MKKIIASSPCYWSSCLTNSDEVAQDSEILKFGEIQLLDFLSFF